MRLLLAFAILTSSLTISVTFAQSLDTNQEDQQPEQESEKESPETLNSERFPAIQNDEDVLPNQAARKLDERRSIEKRQSLKKKNDRRCLLGDCDPLEKQDSKGEINPVKMEGLDDDDNEEDYNGDDDDYWNDKSEISYEPCVRCRFYIQDNFFDSVPEFEEVERDTATWPGKREDFYDSLMNQVSR